MPRVAMIEKETLGWIITKAGDTAFHDTRRDVETDVVGVTRQRKLVSITAAELHNRSNRVLFDKGVEDVRLALAKHTEAPRSRVAATGGRSTASSALGGSPVSECSRQSEDENGGS